MPYVQSERSNLYSLHLSACSRGLQAKGEKELVLGLSRVSCGPSETLLSSGWNVCVCYQVFFFLPPKWPKSSPFIVEGRTRTVHVLLCGVVPIGVARPSPVACPCGGVVVGVVHPWSTGRPIRSCASWEPRECLGVDAAANVQATVDGLCARPRLGRCQGLHCGGGVSAGTNPKIAEALVYSAEALSGRLIVGTVLGHSSR